MRKGFSNRTTAGEEKRPVPWMWLAAGAIVTLIGLALLVWSLGSYLARPPETDSLAIAPTIIRLTAPPVPTASIEINPPTPTVAPTATPAATPDRSVAPPEITAGFYAEVIETGGVGVTVRNGPNTSNQPMGIASEGSRLLVLDGPTPGGEYQWWQVRLQDGTEGWVAGDFLQPAAAP